MFRTTGRWREVEEWLFQPAEARAESCAGARVAKNVGPVSNVIMLGYVSKFPDALAFLPRPCNSRGVAQPGRAPGSGPGGRRFKSSLPDHYFQGLKPHFWFR